MAKKYVTDYQPAKAISAYVILKGSKLIGRVQAYHGNGVCKVDAWDWSNPQDSNFQQGSAGGYGYDRFTAALRGITIGGVKLTDHCGSNEATEHMMAQYLKDPNRADWGASRLWQDRARKIGATFANWHEGEGYASLHVDGGLKQLEGRGFQVIQAI